MANFREASRFTLLAIVPAAILAGIAVEWNRRRAAPLLVVVLALGGAAGLLDRGPVRYAAAAARPAGVPDRLPAVDGPIAADHSNSIVVDGPVRAVGRRRALR